jgi:hypothetical protein
MVPAGGRAARACMHVLYHSLCKTKLFISRSCPILVLTTVLGFPRRADLKKDVKNYQGSNTAPENAIRKMRVPCTARAGKHFTAGIRCNSDVSTQPSAHIRTRAQLYVSKTTARCPEHSEAGGATSSSCKPSHATSELDPFGIYFKNDICTARPS